MQRAFSAAATCALGVLAWSVPAVAGPAGLPRTVDTSHFRIAAGRGYLVTLDPLPLKSWAVSGALFVDFAHGVLVAVDPDTGEAIMATAPVQWRLGTQAAVGFGILDHAEIGLNALLVPIQEGHEDLLGAGAAPVSRTAFGDLRFSAKINPYPNPDGLSVAAAMEMTFPTGTRNAFLRDRSVTFAPVLIAGIRVAPVTAAVNVAYILRRPTELVDLRLDDELKISLAADVAISGEQLGVYVDSYVRVGVKAGAGATTTASLGPEEVPAEVMAGVRFHVGPFALKAGVGLGLGTGYGAPRFRAFLGGGLMPPPRDPVDDTAAPAAPEATP